MVRPTAEANGRSARPSGSRMRVAPLTETVDEDAPVVVIGAGPAGLTAAYQLTKAARPVLVLEADDVVGGISRTVERDGWRFDIGGHRFFTKVQAVEDLWHEILDDEDFLLRPRMSRIYYDGKFFDYPLRAFNALKNLGVIEATLCVLSYAWVRVRPPKDLDSLRGMDGLAVRLAALPHLLQDLHREGLGGSGHRAQGGLRRSEDQDPFARKGDRERPVAEEARNRRDEPDRGVPVPEATARG